MSRRYTYSRTIDTPEGKETFTAEQFDSFDEARAAVEKGVRDRRLQFPAQAVVPPELPKTENKEATNGHVPTGSATAPEKTN